MRSYLILLSFLIPVLTACKDKQTDTTEAGDPVEEVVAPDTEDKLLGLIQKEDLMKPAFTEWFQPAYEDYQVNTELVNSFKEELAEYEIEVFMGTWCEDSQREVPTLLKILEAADYPMEKLDIIAIDDEIETYKLSPNGEEKGKNIHHVPTIILLKDGAEVNRMIEYPVRTIEEDIPVIISGNYLPYYYVADLVHEKLNSMGLEDFQSNMESLAGEFKGKPRDVYELNTYAKTIFRQGKKEEGIAVAKLNTMIYPEDANSYAGLGARFSDMERYEEAIAQFEKALELAPGDSEFLGLLDEAKEKL
jgi:tetratricopeptide (TPR) repeat protein